MSCVVCVPKGGEYLASDVSFEATNDLSLAHPLGSGAAHVCPGSFVMTQSDYYDAVERCVGLAVAALLMRCRLVRPEEVGMAFTHPLDLGRLSCRQLVFQY